MKRKQNKAFVKIWILSATVVVVLSACGSVHSVKIAAPTEKASLSEKSVNEDGIKDPVKDKNEESITKESTVSDQEENIKNSEKEKKKEKEKQQEKTLGAVTNNGGTVLKCGTSVYYWKYNSDSFEKNALFQNYQPTQNAENELICENDDGAMEVLYKGNAKGELFIVGNRLYFLQNEFKDGKYAYSQELVYMEYHNGVWDKDTIHSVGKGKIETVDLQKNLLIFSGQPQTEQEGLYVIDNNTGKCTFITGNSSFVTYEDGIIYYQDHEITGWSEEAIMGAVALCRSDLDGNTALVTKTESDLYEYKSGGACVIECAQIVDDWIYFSYGHYDGSSVSFQGGNIVRVKKAGGQPELVATISCEKSDFYLFRENGVDKLLYAKNYSQNTVLDLNSKSEQDVDQPMGALGEAFPEYNSTTNETKYYYYGNPDGKVAELFSKSDYASGDLEESVDFVDMECIDNMFYYRVDYGRHNAENDMGWRYSYDRIKTEVYRKNLTTGETVLMYSY